MPELRLFRAGFCQVTLVWVTMVWVTLVWVALIWVAAAPVHAIVIRHDTGYNRYLASETDYPAVFPLDIRDQRKICVATLITERWAISAAHCAQETALLESLRTGQPYSVQIAGETRLIAEVHFHPAWTGVSGPQLSGDEVDLMLLRLHEPVSGIQPVSLYRDNKEMGQLVTFLGWGYSGVGSTGIRVDDGRLRFARNTVAEADVWLRFVFNDPAPVDSLAVDFEGIPGLGDSGGPALLWGSEVPVLLGVAVGELSSAERQRQGLYGAVVIYERLSRHLKWIDSVTHANDAMVPAITRVDK